MPSKLKVAIEISESRLVAVLLEKLKAVPNVEAYQWFNNVAEKGPIAVKEQPDILIIDDLTEGDGIFRRLNTLRGHFPNSAFFVVSANQFPQHIVQVMKAGVSEYLVTPINDQVLANAIEEVRAGLANSGKIARGSIFSFISSKGGLGASVVAVNAACALALRKGTRTALLDMSFQSGDAAVLLDLVPQTTISDIVANFHRLDASFLSAAMARHSSHLEFLSAPANPDDSKKINGEHVASVLSLARKIYDHVIIDIPSMSLNDCTLQAFKASEKIFVITDMSVPSIRNTSRLCQSMKKSGIPDANVEICVNRYMKQGTLSVSDIEKNLGKSIFWLFPNDFKGVMTSINKGTPLLQFAPGSPFSKNIVEFVDKIKDPAAAESYRGIRGVFGKAI